MYTQLYSSTSRTQNVHHFSYHLLMCPGFAVIYRKYMRGFVKPKRLNERGETCQAQMISLKVVWRFVVLSFSNFLPLLFPLTGIFLFDTVSAREYKSQSLRTSNRSMHPFFSLSDIGMFTS